MHAKISANVKDAEPIMCLLLFAHINFAMIVGFFGKIQWKENIPNF
jgi:hypothetical protein